MKEIVIDLDQFFVGNAKLNDQLQYLQKAKQLAGEGNIITLTGRAPIWLYLIVSHALHGQAQKLYYSSPITGSVVIFDHNPF
jgi:hypothetical protein